MHAIERLAPDVVRVLLRFPPASPLPFVAGQYVDVIGAGGIRRSYSIANAERPDKLVELHIRQVPDGMMSRYWFDAARPADLLSVPSPRTGPSRRSCFLTTAGSSDPAFFVWCPQLA